MRVLACLLLCSLATSAKDVGEVKLWFHAGSALFELQEAETEVKLLRFGRDAGYDFDFKRQRFKVPYGEYTLIVNTVGFKSFARNVFVAEPRNQVLVGLQLGQIADLAGSPPQTRIEGCVLAPELDLENLWVRIVPLTGGSQLVFEKRLDRSGRFSIPVDLSEDFLVVAVAPKSPSGLRALATKQVNARGFETTQVEIRVE